MIICCPSCLARFRLDPKKYGGKRITLKCSRCGKAITASVPRNFSTESPRILVGHADPEIRNRISEILLPAGFGGQVCGSGREVLNVMKAIPPRIALLDVGLPEVFTFQVLDALRTHGDLTGIKVLLISSVYNATAYKRPPTTLYGADDYLDQSLLAEHLVPKIRNLVGVDAKSGGGKNSDEETLISGEEKARKLARSIVSNIALKNRNKMEKAIREGNFFRTFDEEIREGSRRFEEQIDAEIRMKEDYLHQAFLSFLDHRRCQSRQQRG